MDPKHALAMLNFIAELYMSVKTPEVPTEVPTADNGKMPTKSADLEEVKST